MSIYSDYAKTKQQIQVLTDSLKGLQEQILKEVSELTEPMRTSDGMFLKVVTNKTIYTAKVDDLIKVKTKEVDIFKKNVFEEVLALQQKEEETGLAKKVEQVSLRYTPNKEDK